MKLGTSVFLLVIILIAFGYVMSDDQHVRKDLDEALVQMEGFKIEVVDVNEKLDFCEQTVRNDQLTMSQQKAEITSLNNVISVKSDELASLKNVIFQQNSRIAELEGNLVKLAEEKTRVQPIQSANAWLQIDPVVLAAILIVQLVWFTLQRRHKNSYVRLSAEERTQIIKMRRMKKSK